MLLQIFENGRKMGYERNHIQNRLQIPCDHKKRKARKPYITQYTHTKTDRNLLDNASRENFSTMGEDRKLKYPKRGRKFY